MELVLEEEQEQSTGRSNGRARPVTPTDDGFAVPPAGGGVDRHSSPERRREARGAPTAARHQQAGGAGLAARRPWAWKSDSHSLSILERSFNLFDKDGDGSISPAELKSVLSNLGEDVQDDMVESMIDIGDISNTGEVKYDDFLNLMTGKPLGPKSGGRRVKEEADVKELFNEIDSDGAHATPRHATRCHALPPLLCWPSSVAETGFGPRAEHRFGIFGQGRGTRAVQTARRRDQEEASRKHHEPNEADRSFDGRRRHDRPRRVLRNVSSVVGGQKP
jgi:hypothetical protein